MYLNIAFFNHACLSEIFIKWFLFIFQPSHFQIDRWENDLLPDIECQSSRYRTWAPIPLDLEQQLRQILHTEWLKIRVGRRLWLLQQGICVQPKPETCSSKRKKTIQIIWFWYSNSKYLILNFPVTRIKFLTLKFHSIINKNIKGV